MKKFRILEFRNTDKCGNVGKIWELKSNGNYGSLSHHCGLFTLATMLDGAQSVADGQLEIYKTRRLSDEYEFKIGDKIIGVGTIACFTYHDNEIRFHYKNETTEDLQCHARSYDKTLESRLTTLEARVKELSEIPHDMQGGHVISHPKSVVIKAASPLDKFNLGNWIYVIAGAPGCTGATGKVGFVTNERQYSGLGSLIDGINIDIDGTIWRVNGSLRMATSSEVQDHCTIKIGEYKVEYSSDNNIKIGCQTYSYEDVMAVRRFLEITEQTTIEIRGEKITLKLINRIIAKFFDK